MHVTDGLPTKGKLRDALKAGKVVSFRATGIGEQSYDTTTLPRGVRLYIVGPHEYERKWFANVMKDERGKLVVH